MASVTSDRHGRWRVRFYDEHGVQQSLRIGRMPKREADRVGSHIEHLCNSLQARIPIPKDTAEWVGAAPPKLRNKLTRLGLVAVESRPVPMTLGEFLESYRKCRADVQESTREQYSQAGKLLEEFFGPRRRIDQINPGDAEEFRCWMKGTRKRPLSENTVRRTCARAKQFFGYAVQKRLIAENPFAGLRRLQVSGSHDRQQFVTVEVTEKVLGACPDDEWRLLVKLCRFGGMRISEAANLRWEHVDLEGGRIRVRCKKTEHHVGRAWRELPVFPELRMGLEAARDRAEEGAEWVLPRFKGNRNHGTHFRRIVKKAKVAVWPKPFQNLRASRETELTQAGHPLHVVCAWLGNTPKVAMAHYLTVTGQDFDAALAGRSRLDGERHERVDTKVAMQVAEEEVHAGTNDVVAGVDREEPPLIPQSAAMSSFRRISEQRFSYPARIRT